MTTIRRACNYPDCDGGYATGYCHNDCRVVACEACGTEGRLYVTNYDASQGCWGERDIGPCPYCDGTGGEIIETQPIEMEDLGEVAP